VKELADFGGYRFIKLEAPEDLENFSIDGFGYFRGFGIIDYNRTFKAWLRKFPRPVFLVALSETSVVGWVHIDESNEGKSNDGNPIYVLRAIETLPELRRKKLGKRLVMLGLMNTVGYMVTKPVNPTVPGSGPRYHKDAEALEKEKKKGLIEVLYSPRHVKHKSSSLSPENPTRLTKIFNLLNGRANVFRRGCKLITNFRPAEEEDVLRVHTKEYLEFIRNYSGAGGGFLGDSTYLNRSSYELALLAAGSAISAGERVLDGTCDFALSFMRPPGHHATRDKYGGYCIFNNAAIMVRNLQAKRNLGKVLILDWDAHAANGTMDIFYSDPTVLLISLHQDPHNFYPHTGFMNQMGKGEGVGYTVNVEMPPESTDNEYSLVLKDVVLPLIDSYKPEFIVGCNGFDAHHSDSYTKLNVTSETFYNMGKTLREKAKHRSAIILEGGYNLYNPQLAHTLINALEGEENPFPEKTSPLKTLSAKRQINKEIIETVKELRATLGRYHNIR
jgi:acetoin utilization deacetylase AcuC-like enzyme